MLLIALIFFCLLFYPTESMVIMMLIIALDQLNIFNLIFCYSRSSPNKVQKLINKNCVLTVFYLFFTTFLSITSDSSKELHLFIDYCLLFLDFLQLKLV